MECRGPGPRSAPVHACVDRPRLTEQAPTCPQAGPATPCLPAEHDDRIQGAIAEASAAGVKLQPSAEVLAVLAAADAVCFDVDSTL